MTPQVQRILVLVLVIFFGVVVPSVPFDPTLSAGYVAGCGAVLLVGSVWLWWRSGHLLWRRRRAGAVLLDLGHPPPDRAGSGAGAVLAVGIALWALLALSPRHPILALGYVGFAAYMLLESLMPFLGTVQLRERGLFLPSQSVLWESIGSYTMDDAMAYTDVIIRYRSWGTFSGYPWEVSIRCPAERRQAVKALMAEYVPNRGRHRLFPPGAP